jgi:uncharacterized protein
VSPEGAVLVCLAGLVAGTINTIVGAGTLVTFPVLLAVGQPALVANVSNTVGLVPGSVTGVWGYRRELTGQRARLLRLGSVALAGGLAGGMLLLVLPAVAFEAIVPVLLVLGAVLVAVQPRVQSWVARRQPEHHRHGGPWLSAGIFGTSMYGGYFGAAQGVLHIGLLGIFLDENLQVINGIKNVLTGVVNGTAALLFVVVAEVNWVAAGLIAVGSSIGGILGATVGRRLPQRVLRVVVVVVAVGVAGWLALS